MVASESARAKIKLTSVCTREREGYLRGVGPRGGGSSKGIVISRACAAPSLERRFAHRLHPFKRTRRSPFLAELTQQNHHYHQTGRRFDASYVYYAVFIPCLIWCFAISLRNERFPLSANSRQSLFFLLPSHDHFFLGQCKDILKSSSLYINKSICRLPFPHKKNESRKESRRESCT